MHLFILITVMFVVIAVTFRIPKLRWVWFENQITQREDNFCKLFGNYIFSLISVIGLVFLNYISSYTILLILSIILFSVFTIVFVVNLRKKEI